MALLAYNYLSAGSGLASFALLALATLIFLFGWVVNPVWFALMGDVVPENIRARWFRQRNCLINAVGIVAILLAGFFLDFMKMQKALFQPKNSRTGNRRLETTNYFYILPC